MPIFCHQQLLLLIWYVTTCSQREYNNVFLMKSDHHADFVFLQKSGEVNHNQQEANGKKGKGLVDYLNHFRAVRKRNPMKPEGRSYVV